MATTVKDIIEFSFDGDTILTRIRNLSPPSRPVPYGKVTEYIGTLDLRDIDYNALKNAYKNPGGDYVPFAKRKQDKTTEKKQETTCEEEKQLSSFSDFIDITIRSEEVFIAIKSSSAVPYGKITEYVRSQNFREVDFNALKKAYKSSNGTQVRFARTSLDLLRTNKYQLEISEDRMKCHLTIFKYEEELNLNDLKFILTDMKKMNVVYGVREADIQILIENRIYNRRITAASGVYPVLGKDGSLNPLVPSERRLAAITDQFSDEIKFNKFDFISEVKSGEVIAVLTPPSEGSQGMTVHGKEISTIPGEKTVIKKINAFSDKERIIASTGGRVLVTDDTISLEPLLILKEVREKKVIHEGSVKIMGDVNKSPLIQATGDIEILGGVNYTPLRAGRNIHVRGALISNLNMEITAGGDFLGRNLSYANITAENILVLSSIFNCRLNACRSVKTLTKDGKAVGGNIRAGVSVNIATVGSEAEHSTQISVATYDIIKQFKKRLVEYYQNLLEYYYRKYDINSRKAKAAEQLKSQSSVGGPANYTSLLNTIQTETDRILQRVTLLNNRISYIKNPDTSPTKAKVESKLLFPKTIIEIGDKETEIIKLTKNTTYYLKDNNLVKKGE